MNPTVTIVESSTKRIKTEMPMINNNNCIDEARGIIQRLTSIISRTDTNRLRLAQKKLTYNCDKMTCPRLEIVNTENNAKALIITDGNVAHQISPADNITSLRKIYSLAIGI